LSYKNQRWVAIARVLGPRGNKGEVAVELLTDFPERLSQVRRVYLGAADSLTEPQAHHVASFWVSQNHQGQGVFHFAGADTISSAEQLRGKVVFLPFEERVTLPSGMYFVSDLAGCVVFDHVEAASTLASSPCSLELAPLPIGTVTGVEFIGEGQQGTPILHVDTRQGELLIPLAEDICFRIDIVARRIDVRLPEGLRDLNPPE
jgi:16S rRNA processing protein RimM